MSSTDAAMAYLEKHGVSPMLNAIVNELVASTPGDPISFLINGLLKEAHTRGQDVCVGAGAGLQLIGLPDGSASNALAPAMVPKAGAKAGAPQPARGAGGTDLLQEPFSARVAVATLLQAGAEAEGKQVIVCGWLRTNRTQKKLCFMSLNDGSCQASLQLVLEKDKVDAATWEAAKGAGNGSAVRVTGPLKVSPAKGQKWELPVEGFELIGPSDGGAATLKVPPFAGPVFGTCACSGRAWWLWGARHSYEGLPDPSPPSHRPGRSSAPPAKSPIPLPPTAV